MNHEGLSAVPLSRAALCVDCEIVSNSPHHVCPVCGSHALTGLSRVLGGTLKDEHKALSAPKYDIELTARVYEVPAPERNRVMETLTRLTELGGVVKCLHVNVESTQADLQNDRVLKAA